jgi:hypothetical protein
MPPIPSISVPAAPAAHDPEAIRLEAFSYDERRDVLPGVARALEGCGGFVLERRTVSPVQIDVCFEMQLRSVLELYSMLIGAGLELTRSSHLSLTHLCTLRKHRRRSAEPFRVISVRLELSFLEELNLASALVPGSATA